MTKNKKNKEKKPVQHRGASKWNLHVQKVRAENPGMKTSEIYKLAQTTYVKQEKKE